MINIRAPKSKMFDERDNISSQSSLIELYDRPLEIELYDSSVELKSYDNCLQLDDRDVYIKDSGRDIQEDNSIHQIEKDELMLREVRNYINLNSVLRAYLCKLKVSIDEKYETKNLKLATRTNKLNTTFLFKFNAPYFKDHDNFSCWLKNNDEKLRNQYKLINYCEFIKAGRFQKWTLHDENKIFSFVHNQLVKQEILNLKLKKIHLKRTMKSYSQLNIQLDKISKEIKQVRTKSFNQLITNKSHQQFDWEQLNVENFNINRSNQECAQYWEFYLNPLLNKDLWSKHEEDDLMRLASKYKCQNWDVICTELNTNRSPLQTFLHFKTALEKNQNFKDQTIKTPETGQITNINISFKNNGEVQLHTITGNCAGNNVAQIIKKSDENSKIIKGMFSKEEDFQILSGVDKFGTDFYMVASLLKNRSVRQVRCRYKRLVNKKTSGFWTLKEDNMLVELVKIYGVGNWSKIKKQFITNRDCTQLRQRYNILKPYFDKSGNLINAIGFYALRRRVTTINNVKEFTPECKLRELHPDSEIDEQGDLKDIMDCSFWSKLNSKQQNKLINRCRSLHRSFSYKLNKFFQEYVQSYLKIVPQCNDDNILELSSQTLYVLYYLNLNKLNIPTKTEVNGMNDPLKSVLTNLLDDKQLVEAKKRLIKVKKLKEITAKFPELNLHSTTSLNKHIHPRKYERHINVTNSIKNSKNDFPQNNSYTLPINISTIMLLKMVYKNQIILQQNLCDKKKAITELPDNVKELQATDLFRKRFYNILNHTRLTLTRKNTNE